ncbi:trypsin-like peptidase domain-containing protein [Streptomyces glaucescens]|uniref:trypsin-like peptidase domain-containing protein n=1 Tax=Streptomyces glaucescens TaxID=1907 RepID=UPI00344F5358
MAARGRRDGLAPHEREERPPAPADTPHDAPPPLLDRGLVRIHDLAGRPRGLGVVADHDGTVLTSHETVDGLPRIVLHTVTGDRSRVVTADAVTPLPGRNLALVRTEGLGADPLPLTTRDRVEAGAYVRIVAGCRREARVLGTTEVTYTATDRVHRFGGALELAIGTAGRDALRLGGGAAGGPVLDTTTGAVVAVVGTALRSGHRDSGFAVPLRPAADGPLAALLARNAATVPAYGADLNLAGVLELTATATAQDGPPGTRDGRCGPAGAEPVERPATERALTAFAHGPAPVLALVGPPGSGRTTQLAALAARRGRGAEPAPTLWLRGAGLHGDDASVADAVRRALDRAARTVRPSGHGCAPLPGPTPGDVARTARDAGRPLLLLLDGPEEMPPRLAQRLPAWTDDTASWLRETGARLVVACRPEYWETAGAWFPAELLYGAASGAPGGVTVPAARTPAVRTRAVRVSEAEPPYASAAGAPAVRAPEVDALAAGASAAGAPPAGALAAGASAGRRELPSASVSRVSSLGEGPLVGLPPCVPLGDLTAAEAARARARYGIADAVLAEPDARHPLTLRLLAEVRAAAPGAPCAVPLDHHDVFCAYLDLMCLRVAVRLAAGNGVRGTAVRRLAARVAGRVHEAARRSLGPRQGELDRGSFEELFPQGAAPGLPGGTGWACAVLAEGLLVPAGDGYRFAHEEFADWIQGMHLDLDEALRALVHRPGPPAADRPPAVPRHRAGPVVQALLFVARHHGTGRLGTRLAELARALDTDPDSWWAARLLTEVLRRVPDATPYLPVLRQLADGVVGHKRRQRPVPAGFGPGFWAGLRLPDAERLALLRRLVLADPAPHAAPGPRYLDVVARLLADAPTAVQRELVDWFDDERPLPATPDATVAAAAQALLHTHRHRALDHLTEVLADSEHARAGELLAVLAEEEPSAVCRAVDRWARDERPTRRLAAVTYGLRTAPHAHDDTDRELLRYAALALLARPADGALHGGALGLLVRDPRTRARHLPRALDHFRAGDPHLPASALAAALPTHPEPVLDAFRARLPHADDVTELLHALTDAAAPGLVRPVAALVREAVTLRPDLAGGVAAYADRRLEAGPAVRDRVLPLVTELLDGGPGPLRAALAAVLAAPGTVRRDLRDLLLAGERDPAVLEALLRAAARQAPDDLRELVHGLGVRLVRTPDGATRYDRTLVDLAREVPGFAARVTGWLAGAPGDWAALVGPSTRRTLEHLAGVRVPA